VSANRLNAQAQRRNGAGGVLTPGDRVAPLRLCAFAFDLVRLNKKRRFGCSPLARGHCDTRVVFVCLMCFVVATLAVASDFSALKPAAFAHHVERFNVMEPETVTQAIPNAEAWAWAEAWLELVSSLLECGLELLI